MRLTLQARLMLAFGVILVLMAVLALVLFDRFGAANQEARDNYTQGFVDVKTLGDAITDIGKMRERLLLVTSAATTSEAERQVEIMNADAQRVVGLIADYKARAQSEGAQQLLEEFEANWDQLMVLVNDVITLAVSGDFDESRLLLVSETDPLLEGVTITLLIAQDIEDNDARARYNTNQNLFQQAQTIGAVLITASIVIGLGLAFWLARTIANPLADMARTSELLASGNLDQVVEVPARRRDEVGVLANAFNQMTVQLRDLLQSLEARVIARTRDLKVASDVSRQVTTVLDLDHLLPRLSDLTKTGFDLYHVGVFLYNDEAQLLKLSAGAGEIGRKFTAQQLELSIEAKTGVIVKAARTREAVIVNDTRQSGDYQANPLLPETRAELALPMAVGTQLVGVLDLQATEVGHFTDENLDVLTTLAQQIAVAVRNADLYTQAEASRTEAEEANKVKSQFLAAMSHELRTPLNSILNFTQFVSRGVLGPINEKQEETLIRVVKAGKHLLSLINDVLDISKIEAGSLELFVQDDINLNDILEDMRDTAQSLLGDKPIELCFDVEDDLPLMMVDERRMRQIVLNMVSNACKFTKEGAITIHAHQENSEVQIMVKDTGPGIDPEYHEEVFQSFRQTSEGLEYGGGTGLGLAITKRLAEAHGGCVWLERGVATLRFDLMQPHLPA